MKRAWPVGLLLVVGTLQMAGDVLGWPALKAIGAATGAAPAPKVFTAQNGFETFANRFFLDWTDARGTARSREITPQTYAGLRGPYNRRNAYGAALSYGPVLAANPQTRPLLESVARHGLCGDAPLLRELGIDPATVAGPVTVRLVPHRPAGLWQLSFEVACA